MSNILGRIVVLLFFVLGTAFSVSAQVTNSSIIPKNNSAISRIGLGDFINPWFVSQSGMAGIGIATHETQHVNPVNPASLSYLTNTSLEAAIYLRSSNWETADGTRDDIWSGNLQYLSLAFPLQNPINQAIENRNPDFSWGMNINLQPYTVVGYFVEVNDVAGEFEDYTNTLKGTGGTYKLNWGNGWRYKDLSVGVNVAYLFGKITNSRRVSLDDLSLNAYSTEFLDEFSVSGFQFNLGMQYIYNIDKETETTRRRNLSRRRIIIGATASNSASFNTNVSRFYNRDNFSIRLNDVDTILQVDDLRLTGQLPSEYGFGITYEKTYNLRLSAEYKVGNWSQYQNEAKPDILEDTYRIAVGGEWTPKYDSYNSYWQRMRYRFGAHYGTDPRSINGVQIENYGLTLGIGLPVISPRQAASFVHFALEVGQLSAGDIIRENYAQMTFGFSLNDNTWFFKRKFN